MKNSTAETLSEHMPEYTIITREWCPPCMEAKKLLKEKDLEYVELDQANLSDDQRKRMEEVWHGSFPQIFKWSKISKENLIGWYSEFEKVAKKITNNKVNKIMNTDKAFAQQAIDTPIETALFDSPLSKDVAKAQMWFLWWTLWILWWVVWWAVSWWNPAWIVLWWASAAWLWVLIEKKSKENDGKWFGNTIKHWWIIATWIWVAKLTTSGTFFLYLVTALWTMLALNVLFYFLTGKKAEAEKIINKNAWSKEEAEKIVTRLESAPKDELEQIWENIWKELSSDDSGEAKKAIRV